MDKKAKCIRNSSSWSKLKKEHKFDSSIFKEETILDDIGMNSPKLLKLMDKIKELDERDLKEQNKLFKHVIYSDVQGIYGSKIIAAIFIAYGYDICFEKNLKMKNKMKENNTFALLSSSVVYNKPFSINLKKSILNIYNNRPDNVNGKNIRFIILDQGYKEGIDLFDVKYFHIMEPLITKADETQVIGRATRFCGQKGLRFVPNIGWILNVFKYNLSYDKDTTVFDLFMKYSNINLSYLNLTADLEEILKISAVDYFLNLNVHDMEKNKFKMLIDDGVKYYNELNNSINVGAYGKMYDNDKDIQCMKKCHGALQGTDNGLLLSAALNCDLDYYNIMDEKYPRNILCNRLAKDKFLCKNVNNIWRKPVLFFKKYGDDLLKKLEDLKASKNINTRNYNDIMIFMNKYIKFGTKNKPPNEFYGYFDLRNYINTNYYEFRWKKIEKENLCKDKKENNNDKIEFSVSQNFVRNYFTPKNVNNGLLLYHSVGTGKTCSGIAVASNFQREDYTIIWVTRHTLKQDIWKNMFEKICNTVIQEEIDKGLVLPEKLRDRMKLINENWFPILSYKQFTNLIAKKNKFYDDLVKRNGKDDPFRKTLIIIDEVHKLYSKNLSGNEKPDIKELKSAFNKSYKLSKKESVKLLLLTATPITDDPLSLVKILNLMLDEKDEFNEDPDNFIKEYCNENGLFNYNGFTKFLNKTVGIVSYLNRSSDLRQFAYPVISNVLVEGVKNNLKERLEILEKNKVIEKNKEKLKEIKVKIKETKKDIKDDRSVLTVIDECIRS